MVEKLLTEVYVPAAQRIYEVRLAAGMNAHDAAVLTALVLSEATQGLVQPSRSSMLCWRETGAPLDERKTLWESGVRNGCRFILI